MIHDAKVGVTCDHEGCRSSDYVELEWVYTDYSGNSGYYNSDEEAVEKTLKELDWVMYPKGVSRENYHFCCDACLSAFKARREE